MLIEVVTHYHQDDVRCSSDYIDMEIFVDGEFVKSWGDDYHDKGHEKVEGFLEAVEHFFGSDQEITIKRTHVADRDIPGFF